MSDVRLDIADHVAVLTLDDPERKNAMTADLLDRFGQRLADVRADRTVRALVITGAGKAFCQGADFSTMGAIAERLGGDGPAAMQAAIRTLYDAFLAVDDVAVPTIAAVNGAAVGGGLGLALLCDLRIVAETAKLGANFAQLGIHSGLGITALLPRLVGWQAAAEMLYTGDFITGTEAARIGLAREAVPVTDVLPRAMHLAKRIAAGAPLAVRQMKRTLRIARGYDFASILEIESFAQALLSQTEDAREGIASVLARRPPVWKGR